MTDFIYDLMTTRQCFTFRRPHCIITLACNAQTLSSAATGPIDNRKAQIPLCSSRLDTIRSTCRAHAFCLCRACWTALLDTLVTTSSTGATRRTCRVVSRRGVTSQVEFGLKQVSKLSPCMREAKTIQGFIHTY